jgi:hypothetical protein
MNAPTNGWDTEDRLRQALRREATHADHLGTGFEQVRARAVRVRRRRRVAVATLAAAAVAVVTVPTALLLQGDRDAGAPPTHQPTTPTPSVSPSPTPPTPSATTAPSPSAGPLVLSAMTQGPAPQATYLDGRAYVALDGSRTTIPGQRPVQDATPYHGGWLVVDADDGHLYQYDNTGKETDLGRNGVLAISGDQMRTAFQVDGVIRVGIATGMGEGEQALPLPKDAGLVGFVASGLVYSSGYRTYLHPDTGADRALPLIGATTTWASGNLVGGQAATGSAGDSVEGAVVDTDTGAVLWHSGWRPVSFSPDGKYVAAVPAGDNGDFASIAILDAHTGREITRMGLLNRKVAQVGQRVAWEGNDALLFDVADRQQREAIVRLAIDRSVDRATPVLPGGKYPSTYNFPPQP